MFKLISIFGLMLGSMFFASAQESSGLSARKISMGEIKHRDTATVVLEYTNNSDVTKILLDAKANCDCTWLEYPKSPIAPGETVKLTVIYNAKDKGIFMKNIDIFISDGKRERFSVVGSVVDKVM